MAIIGLAAFWWWLLAWTWQVFLRPAAPPPAPPWRKADLKQMALPLPELPSIAVLPFVNLSEDPNNNFCAMGLPTTSSTLSPRCHGCSSSPASSTFAYKGKTVKAKQVSEELGVRYVMEGSVQRSEGRIRISAQLVDALSGRTVWTERYDRDLANVFGLQDEITMKILTALRLKFGQGEQAAIVEKHYKGGQSFECYLKRLEAATHIRRWNAEDIAVALRLAEEAIAQCPEHPQGM